MEVNNNTAPDVGIEEREDEQPEVWAEYVCKTIDFGAPHPGHLVEASVLSSIELPPANYPVQESLKNQILNKSLSRIQLEGILYASQRFQYLLPDGSRAGFYLGDSAGVGKGRQISGIILDSLLRGRSRHCWLSVSADLHIDATRDLRDIGCLVEVMESIAKLTERKPMPTSAVVFSTYHGLISRGNSKSPKTRMDELIEWLQEKESSKPKGKEKLASSLRSRILRPLSFQSPQRKSLMRVICRN